MSREELTKAIPDTYIEWEWIGSAINRLGTSLSLIGAVQKNFTWVIITAGLTWFGHELSEYFKFQIKTNGKDGSHSSV